jgi:hypothetical protein
MDLFGLPYSYEQRLRFMLGYAQDAGLRPPSGPKFAGESVRAVRPVDVPAAEPARTLTRAEREELYGPPMAEIITHRPARRPATADDIMRRLIPSYR